MKKSKDSKSSKKFGQNNKRVYLDSTQKKQGTIDDQEEEMISKKDLRQIGKAQQKGAHKAKYYHIINQNLDESEYQNEQGELSTFRQLSLKNLITFMSLLLLVMVGTYKIIEQIYQIEHPEQVIFKTMSEKRLSMQKQTSLAGKQQTKAQAGQNSQGTKQVPDRLEMTQKRFREKFQGNNVGLNHVQIPPNNGVNQQKKAQNQKNNQNLVSWKGQQSQSQKKEEQNDSVMREKQQDIMQSLSNSAYQQLTNRQQQMQQSNKLKNKDQQADKLKIKNGHQSPLPNHSSNPVAQNSNQYLWKTYDSGPVAKANITKSQAIQWKNYVKMIQLPIKAPFSSHPLLQQQYTYFQNKYQISSYPQLPICVVIPSYNNAASNRYRMNIQSILQQNYTNYHVVFIDDKSDDRTGELFREYLQLFQPKFRQKVKIIINSQRKMAMPNLRNAAINECKEEELFVIIDGDDALIGRQVFKLFSAVMQQKNLWVMWTNFISPKGTIGYSRQYPYMHRANNNYRKAGFVMSHLRAYYTKLFRLIKDQDLKDQNGDYFHAANDVAIGIPILEMAHLHTAYVPEISYFYNMNTGLNNHKVRLKEQKNNDKKIRKKPRYEPLKSLDFRTQSKTWQSLNPSSQAKPQPIEKPSKDQLNQIIKIQKPLSMDQMEQNLHRNVNKAQINQHKTDIGN